MGRIIALVLFVALGLAFLSRTCVIHRPNGPLALMNARIVDATGIDHMTRFVLIDDGKVAAVALGTDRNGPPSGTRQVDVNGLYVAATTFDRAATVLIDGVRHVWVGQLQVGDPGDVVVTRTNPGRIRAGYVPETEAIVAAVVDGVYYTARELSRRR